MCKDTCICFLVRFTQQIWQGLWSIFMNDDRFTGEASKDELHTSMNHFRMFAPRFGQVTLQRCFVLSISYERLPCWYGKVILNLVCSTLSCVFCYLTVSGSFRLNCTYWSPTKWTGHQQLMQITSCHMEELLTPGVPPMYKGHSINQQHNITISGWSVVFFYPGISNLILHNYYIICLIAFPHDVTFIVWLKERSRVFSSLIAEGFTLNITKKVEVSDNTALFLVYLCFQWFYWFLSLLVESLQTYWSNSCVERFFRSAECFLSILFCF